jgi:hypothetical protein
MTSFTTYKCTYLQGLAFVTCVVGTNVQPKTMLKGHGNDADFLEFLHKSVPHESLSDLSSRCDFVFEFTEIFVIEKGLPESGSRQDTIFWKPLYYRES